MEWRTDDWSRFVGLHYMLTTSLHTSLQGKLQMAHPSLAGISESGLLLALVAQNETVVVRYREERRGEDIE